MAPENADTSTAAPALKIATTDETGSGCAETIAAIKLVLVVPWKARCPVAISYSRIPRAKISDRASTFLPSACSGDM